MLRVLSGMLVCAIGGAGAVVLVDAISGNCCRKLASKSSPGFCELRLRRGNCISNQPTDGEDL